MVWHVTLRLCLRRLWSDVSDRYARRFQDRRSRYNRNGTFFLFFIQGHRWSIWNISIYLCLLIRCIGMPSHSSICGMIPWYRTVLQRNSVTAEKVETFQSSLCLLTRNVGALSHDSIRWFHDYGSSCREDKFSVSFIESHYWRRNIQPLRTNSVYWHADSKFWLSSGVLIPW